MIAHAVDLVQPTEVIPEDQLLDVGVVVFDPGVPEGEIPKDVLEELIREGTFVHIRRMESMYMAVQLQKTLQNSGHWGAVWVMPEPSNAADVNVTAKILHSDGDIVRVRAQAVDATGRVWIDDVYELETAAGVYNRQRYPNLDPYQDLFNMIANDLAAAQAALSANQRSRVRTVAALRYAEELSPEAFSGYVEEKRDGTYELKRLPAENDPMFARTERVRARERLFVETLGAHYAGFSRQAEEPYHGWREYAREEAISIRELTKSARWRTGLGIATILASVVYGSNAGNDSFSDRVLRDALVYMGMDVLQTGAIRRQEKRLHTEALEELSLSFEDEVQPLVVEIKGTEHRLTGTAEAQYHEWRDLLRRLFETETGFAADDVNIYMEPEPLEPGIEPEPEPATGSAEDPTAPADGDAPADTSGSVEAPDAEATDAAETTDTAGGADETEGADDESKSEAPSTNQTGSEARIASDAAAAGHGA
ncbi:MAG TPA: hypothetical protein VF339_06410 [Gammaproteobacteria bacterium]